MGCLHLKPSRSESNTGQNSSQMSYDLSNKKKYYNTNYTN